MPSELMPAAVYVGDGRIAVEEVPCPEPGPGEVLVEIAECGICGSDLHMVLERYAKPGAFSATSGQALWPPRRVAPAGLPGIVSWTIRPGVRRVPALSAGPPFGVRHTPVGAENLIRPCEQNEWIEAMECVNSILAMSGTS